MSTMARAVISGIFLMIAAPFGIILLLMSFNIFKNYSTTGLVYLRGLFEYIFVYILLNFLFSFIIAMAFIIIKKINATHIKITLWMVFVLLLHDLPALKSVISDVTKGISPGIPWTGLLMAIHIMLFIALFRIMNRLRRPQGQTQKS